MCKRICCLLAALMILALSACGGIDLEQAGTAGPDEGTMVTSAEIPDQFSYNNIQTSPADQSRFSGRLRLNGRYYLLEKEELEYLTLPVTLEEIAARGYDILLQHEGSEKLDIFGLNSESPGIDGKNIYFYRPGQQKDSQWEFDGGVVDPIGEGITVEEAIRRGWWNMTYARDSIVMADFIDVDETDKRLKETGPVQFDLLLETLGQPSMVIVTYEGVLDGLDTTYYRLAYEYGDYTLAFGFWEELHPEYHWLEMQTITYYPLECWQVLRPVFMEQYETITI